MPEPNLGFLNQSHPSNPIQRPEKIFGSLEIPCSLLLPAELWFGSVRNLNSMAISRFFNVTLQVEITEGEI